MRFSSGQNYNTVYTTIKLYATDLHLLIQVQQVGIETDEKPLIP